MEALIKRIQEANTVAIDCIFEAALCRKRELYPEWRIYYAAVPLEDKQEREQTIACMLRYLKAEGEGH